MSTGFEPDEPPPVDWVVLVTWVGGGALTLLLYAAIAWGCVSLFTGCATGRVRVYETYVDAQCFAIGEDAKVIYSSPTGEAGILTNAPTKLISCEGGPLIPSLLDGIGGVIKAAWSFLPMRL